MRILLLTTTARIRTDWVASRLEALPVRDVDLRLVTVGRPAERLPVSRCLVVGASLRPRRRVRDAPVLNGPRPAAATGRWSKRVDRVLMRALPAGRRKDRQLMLATGAVWSPEVRAEFAAADLVIADDYNTTWAAWLLSRRVPGPHVVFQVEGVELKLAELAEDASR